MANIVTIPVEFSEGGELTVFVDLSNMEILIPVDFPNSREYIRGEVESRVADLLIKEIEHSLKTIPDAYDSLKQIADSIKQLDGLHAYYPNEI